MNKAQRQAIESMIGNHADNLFRFKAEEHRHPGSKTGNGEPFTKVIADLEKSIAELKEGL